MTHLLGSGLNVQFSGLDMLTPRLGVVKINMNSQILALLNVILTGVYVFLTLGIVIFTAFANKTTRVRFEAIYGNTREVNRGSAFNLEASL
jgi:hypothetical protein